MVEGGALVEEAGLVGLVLGESGGLWPVESTGVALVEAAWWVGLVLGVE